MRIRGSRGTVPSELAQRVQLVAGGPAAQAVRCANDALRSGDLPGALRQIDRAWRTLPEDAPALAPVYARLLALEDRDHAAALRLLQRALEFGPDAELEALRIRSLLRLDRNAEAAQQLEAGLASYCLVPGQALSQAAAEAVASSGAAAAGWVAVGPGLVFVGQLVHSRHLESLQIEAAGRALRDAAVHRVRVGGRDFFRFEPPKGLGDQRFEFRVDGVRLLGSGCGARPEFALDGRAAQSGRTITGWARIGWLPAEPVRLLIEDQDGRCVRMKTARVPQTVNRWPFELDLRKSGLRGSRFRISALLPDGRTEGLPDTPLLLAAAVRLPASAGLLARRTLSRRKDGPTLAAGTGSAEPTEVITALRRAHVGTFPWLENLLATMGSKARVVVVDAAGDAALTSRLDEMSACGRIAVLRSGSDQKVAAAINRAMELRPSRDVVLLDPDTKVFGNWLHRLRVAAYGAKGVGTATPFCNDSTFAAYPGGGCDRGPSAGDEAVRWDAMAAEDNSGVAPGIPVGSGPCLYVRRDCLRDVGGLDQLIFESERGPLIDLCLRARARGWSHRLATDVFAYRPGADRDGGRCAALLERDSRLLELRHPGYEELLTTFLKADSAAPMRRILDERRLCSFAGAFVLVVASVSTGGVDRFVAQRCRDIRAGGGFPLVLKPSEPESRDRAQLWTEALVLPNLNYAVPAEVPALRALLSRLRIAHVEIQHFLGMDPRVVEAALAVARPYDVYLHDYAWICPRVTLVDGSGRYCGEPDISACEACIRRNGSKLGELLSVAALRRRSDGWLSGARAVVAPSADAAVRYRRYFPDLALRVEAYSPLLVSPPRPPAEKPASIVRVVLIGAISEHKGYRVLLECARDAANRRLPLEFVIIGYTQDDELLFKTGKVFVTGRYNEGEVPDLLRREQPNLVFFPSVWPETWCFALDYAVRARLPVAAFDLGAIAERLRALGLGILLALDCDAQRINDRILRAASEEYLSMINTQVRRDEGKTVEGLSASVQVLPLPVGLYLFSVNAAAPTIVAGAGNFALPAIHVGLGPGVRPEQVEFVSGPGVNGSWLFAQGDMLVVKVTGAGTTLIVSSIRAPGGETLSVKIERLESRVDGEKPQAAARPGQSQVTDAPSRPPDGAPSETDEVPVQISAHIRERGDRRFTGVPWAGRVGPGQWIESFSIQPLNGLGPQDIEYKGLTAQGFETPWITNDQMCGTRGMAVPLVGFAVRLKAGAQAAAYDCEYGGYFQSGTIAGPFRNGAPCRSSVASDPLEGLQIRIVRRGTATPGKPASDTEAAGEEVNATAEPAPSARRVRVDAGTARSGGPSAPGKRRAPVHGRDPARRTVKSS